ncbi:MAG: glutamate-1-semialdehyde 2,1-aminomutase [Bacteroidota bacterium]
MTPDLSRYARSREHQARAHALIPGGAHTYAKGDDQMPEPMPVVIERGEGCRVWDVDGNEYVEYGMGLRAVTLGHAEPRVNAAAARMMAAGLNFTRPASVELEAAEAFVDLIPGAERVKFCKDGSSATTAAIKLARAATGRDLVAMCGDHPFLSQDDWFMGTTDMNAGIPQAVRDLSIPFAYGDAEALRAVFSAHPGQIACVILEAVRGPEDPSAYMREVREICDREGAVFILDEMITGFRWDRHGAQGLFGIEPDLSSFGKALANGFACSAVAGRAEIMDLGGLTTEADRVFLLSATHGAETVGLGAALETMRIYREEDVTGQLHAIGARLREGVREVTEAHGVGEFVGTAGRDCNLVFFTRDPEGRPSQPFRTLFLQEMTARGVLAPSFVVSTAHDDRALAQTLDALDGALAVYARALDAGTTDGFLIGRPVQPVFRRKNGTVWSPEPGASGDGASLAPSRLVRATPHRS